MICYIRKWKKTFVDQTHYAHKRSHMGFFNNLKVFYLHVIIASTLLVNYTFALFCFTSFIEHYQCVNNASNWTATNAALKTKMYVKLSSACNWPGKIKLCTLLVWLFVTYIVQRNYWTALREPKIRKSLVQSSISYNHMCKD